VGGSTFRVADAHGIRSAPVLLPDGRVFLGGGNGRNFDYEIFSPPYLQLPATHKPVNVAFQPAPVVPTLDVDLNAHVLGYDETYRIQCNTFQALGVTIEKVVLMAPCSDTHHSDMSQRYFEMGIQDVDRKPAAVSFVTPPNDQQAPRGIYMLFLVTSSGAVSEAIWVVLR